MAAELGGRAEEPGVAGDAAHREGVRVVDLAQHQPVPLDGRPASPPPNDRRAGVPARLGVGQVDEGGRGEPERRGDPVAEERVEARAGQPLEQPAEDDEPEVGVDRAASRADTRAARARPGARSPGARPATRPPASRMGGGPAAPSVAEQLPHGDLVAARAAELGHAAPTTRASSASRPAPTSCMASTLVATALVSDATS